MRFVPEALHQAWVIDHLAELIRARGKRTFLSAQLVEPTPAFFPDPWHRDVPSVRRILRRTLDHAGLGELTFDLDLDPREATASDDAALPIEGAPHAHEVAAWFSGLSEDLHAHFGVVPDQLADPEGLVAILCHETAHAYRARHELTFFDPDEDELLTDLTTVYLGFGVLTANLTHRYRRRSTTTEKKMGGYLTPVVMSFALAVQVVARDLPKAEVQRIARLLEAAQEGCFLEAHRILRGRRDNLLKQLGLPADTRGGAAEPVRARINEGQVVFRIKGGWFRKPKCSGIDCGAALDEADTICAVCGGAIRGDVADRREAKSREEAAAHEAGQDLLRDLGLGKPTK